MDSAGNLFISDTGNNRIRKVTKTIISTIAGSGTAVYPLGGYGGDNGMATNAQLYSPVSIGLDASGRVYIADDNNSRIRVLRRTSRVFGSGGFCGSCGGQRQFSGRYYRRHRLDGGRQ